MCGINGFTWKDEALIRSMNEATKYRGPDDSGVYLDGGISMGLSRLAIIDLSANGHQPMSNEDDTIWITYNGEVYNFQDIRQDLLRSGHRFRSKTDTEVIIHAYEEYGIDCFNKFNGMWGLAIYDKNKEALILSRDRFGIKPLYYYVDEHRLIFSSMIAGILRHGIETGPNDRAIMEYLAFNLEQHDTYTFFKNINSLTPGHLLIYDLRTKKYRIQRWYTPTLREVKNPEALRQYFIESVRLWTVSDVPIGVCLSGGVDSTAITCVLDKYLTSAFNTYSLIAPGSSVDESKYIKEVGRYTNTKQFFTTICADKFLADVYDFIVAMEEPVTGLSAYAQYIVFKLAHEQGAKVLLDGQGGDELFAGYVYYFGYHFYDLFSKLQWYTLAKEMILCFKKLKELFPHSMFFFLLLPKSIRDAVWKKMVVPWVNHELLEQVCDGEKDPRWRKMGVKESLLKTLFSTSIPHNLMWEDKSSMRWSIESRVPFMDVALVEAAISLTPTELLKDGETKCLFKEAMYELLPEMIRNRKDKIGFAAPDNDFFRNDRIVSFAKEIIYSDCFRNRFYWNWKVLEKIFLNHIAKKTNAGQEIWKWINLEIWLREFIDSRRGGEVHP